MSHDLKLPLSFGEGPGVRPSLLQGFQNLVGIFMVIASGGTERGIYNNNNIRIISAVRGKTHTNNKPRRGGIFIAGKYDTQLELRRSAITR